MRRVLALMDQMSPRARWRHARDADPEYIGAVLEAQDAAHEAGIEVEPQEFAPSPTEYDLVSDTIAARTLALVAALARRQGFEVDEEYAAFPMPRSPLHEAMERRREERIVLGQQDSFAYLFSVVSPPVAAVPAGP